jgi:hypothetical protein
MDGSVLVALAALLAVTACTGVTRRPAPLSPPAAAVPDFTFGQDTLAFANEIRARNPHRDGLYANYCFVLARAVRQFHAVARFDPASPRLDRTEYAERVRRVAAHDPWARPLPAAERVVIPGYRNLHEFSRAEEAAVKEGLGSPLWSWLHWTNWRVTFPVTGGHQEGVAGEIVDQLAAGRLVQLLVTNWPTPELNHTVVVYAYRRTGAGIDLLVYDPNDPASPGTITFDSGARRFWATRLHDTRPGRIRAFRMYYSRLL